MGGILDENDKSIRKFGPFELDPSRHQLLRDGQEIPLSRNELKLLLLLTDPGIDRRTLGYQEIVPHFWAEFKPSEWNDDKPLLIGRLHQMLGGLKKKFPDGVNGRQLIKSVPGVGLQFVCEVEYVSPPSPAAKVENAPPPGVPVAPPEPDRDALDLEEIEPDPPVRSRRGIAILAVVIAGIGSGVIFLKPWSSQPAMVVVMPVANNSGDQSNDAVAEGFTEELITQLKFMGDTRILIAPRAASASYKGRSLTISGLRKQLKTDQVDYLLEGSIHKYGVNLTVNVRLERVSNSEPKFVRSFPTDSKSILSQVPSIMARGVVDAILGQAPSPDTPRAYLSSNNEANDAFDHGNALLLADLPDQALKQFQIVERLDANYLDVYTKLAICYYRLGEKGLLDQRAARKDGDTAIEEALLRYPNSADVHAAQGFSLWFFGWDWDGAIAKFKTAIEKDEKNVDAHRWYALALATAGKNDEAKEEIDRALQSNAGSQSLLTDKAWIEYLGHRPANAARILEGVMQGNPRYGIASIRLWAVYTLLGRHEQAIQQLCNISECMTSPDGGRSLDAMFRRSGYRSALGAWLNLPKPAEILNALTRAQIASYSGDTEAAIRILTAGCQSQDGWLVYAAADPAFDRLRRDVRMRVLNDRSCRAGS